MTENTDKLTITLKADGSAPWIVVHANSREEADALLSSVYSGGQNLAEHAAAASAVVTLAWSDEKKRQNAGAVDRVQQAIGGPPAQNDPEQNTGRLPETYTCQHGERVHRKDANGKWEAMFCPTEKGTIGQCDPLWKNKKTGKFE